MGRADRLSARTSHFMGDVVMKAPLSAFDRNCPVACVGSASDDIAILQVASRPNDVWKQCKSANGQQRNNQLIHVNPLGISDHTSPACAPAAAKVPPTNPSFIVEDRSELRGKRVFLCQRGTVLR
jgi:hypothetical protein